MRLLRGLRLHGRRFGGDYRNRFDLRFGNFHVLLDRLLDWSWLRCHRHRRHFSGGHWNRLGLGLRSLHGWLDRLLDGGRRLWRSLSRDHWNRLGLSFRGFLFLHDRRDGLSFNQRRRVRPCCHDWSWRQSRSVGRSVFQMDRSDLLGHH
jgi:hypothetical protein